MALTTAQIAKIEALREIAGQMTRKEIAEKYNVSPSVVVSFGCMMRAIGIDFDTKESGAFTIEELKAMLAAGISHAQIAAHFGLKPQSVSVRVMGAGLSKKRHRSKVDIDALIGRKAAE